MATKKTRPVVEPSSGVLSNVVTSFGLAGFDWTVVFVKDLSEYGKCDVNTQTIYIRDGMNEQTTKQTFYHELVHAIMFSMGHTQHDEIFTDAFGGMLLQFEKTAKL
jgi:hypothetical protein